MKKRILFRWQPLSKSSLKAVQRQPPSLFMKIMADRIQAVAISFSSTGGISAWESIFVITGIPSNLAIFFSD